MGTASFISKRGIKTLNPVRMHDGSDVGLLQAKKRRLFHSMSSSFRLCALTIRCRRR